MGALFIIRMFWRLILLVLAVGIVQRSFHALGSPARVGGRAQIVPWLGLVVGSLVILSFLRSVGLRL